MHVPRTAAVAILLVLLTAGAGHGEAPPVQEGAFGLPDGAAWLHARVTLEGVPCLRFVLAGAVAPEGDGRAVVADMPGVGAAALYFADGGQVAVRTHGAVAGLEVDVDEGLSAADAARPFRAAFEACHPAGGVWSGAFDAWVLHTAGVTGDVSRVTADEGAVDVTPLATGTRVRLLGIGSFEGRLATEVGAPRVAGVAAPGAAVAYDVGARVAADGSVFGAFALFDPVGSYELAGPGGAYAWKDATGAGGTIDPLGFHGPPGEWRAHVHASVSRGTPAKAFFVIADLAG